jgi:hypothetical protein
MHESVRCHVLAGGLIVEVGQGDCHSKGGMDTISFPLL